MKSSPIKVPKECGYRVKGVSGPGGRGASSEGSGNGRMRNPTRRTADAGKENTSQTVVFGNHKANGRDR